MFLELLKLAMGDIVFFKFNKMIDIFGIDIAELISIKTLFLKK